MKIDIAHISKLANISPKRSEQKNFEKQLSVILEHFDKLKEVLTDKIEETSQVTGLMNITRCDEVKISLTQKEALANAKNVNNGAFVVPVILEEAVDP